MLFFYHFPRQEELDFEMFISTFPLNSSKMALLHAPLTQISMKVYVGVYVCVILQRLPKTMSLLIENIQALF